MVKIVWILPVGIGTYDERMLSYIKRIKRPDVEAEVCHLKSGLPDNLEYHYYEHLVADDLLHKIMDYERKGFSAAIIGCFYDGGLREARELVRMPVVAEEEACIHVATTLGHKFSIIVGRRKWLPKMEDNVRLYGLSDKLASIRPVEYSTSQMAADRKGYLDAVRQEAEKAIKDDGAEVIVLSEEASFDFEDLMKLQSELRVPIIDPLIVTWKFAEFMADLYHCANITHSKLAAYEAPPGK